MLRRPESVRVLYVEDDPEASRLFSRRLAWSSTVRFDVEAVSDLQSALSMLSTRSFDLVLLDLSLPDAETMSTLVAAGAIARSIPIVVLTANDDDEIALLAARLGVQDLLVKSQQLGRSVERSLLNAIERHRWVRGAVDAA
jgi:DNA-binding response OmpR family regulator